MQSAVHAGRTVVLVEDHEDSRVSMAMALRLLGYQVHEAGNGAVALVLISQVKPHAVISDLEMPDMSGLELARRVRETHGASIRLIALTGMPPRKVWGASLAAGFDFYLLKPVRTEELIPYIENEPVKDL
jgi:two-component system CheB/CheR fusion protein